VVNCKFDGCKSTRTAVVFQENKTIEHSKLWLSVQTRLLVYTGPIHQYNGFKLVHNLDHILM
jgi:hypothetical protein